ncbi:MAG: PsiF family protein, partial [Ideonella sp.]
MKTLISTLALVAATAFAGTAFASSHKGAPDMAAAGASAPMGKQQTKMGECNTSAKDMKGDDRKSFMKTCLSNKKPTQQMKMKTCNADAKGKAGDERKAFMK